MGEGGHGVEQVSGLPGPRLIGGAGGVVVRRSVAQADGDPVLLCAPDKLQGAGLLGRQGNQLHHALGRLLQAVEHGRVRVVEEGLVLGPLLGLAQEGPLQMEAHQLRAPGVLGPVGGGVLADAGELVLPQGHARRADLGDAPGELDTRAIFWSPSGVASEKSSPTQPWKCRSVSPGIT